MKRLLIAIAALIVIAISTYWFMVSEGIQTRVAESARKGLARFGRVESQFPQLYQRAVQGDVDAQFRIGEALLRGDGIAKDPATAAEWIQKAARQGHSTAAYLLGVLYENGEGVPQSYFRAADWYRLAARLGNDMRAEFALGELYFHGRGLPHDYGEARIWYDRAAKQGHPVAQHLMGAMYQEGWSVDRDFVQAYMWYTLALPRSEEINTVNRNYNPAKARKKLLKRMNKAQIQEAEELAREWRPRTKSRATF